MFLFLIIQLLIWDIVVYRSLIILGQSSIHLSKIISFIIVEPPAPMAMYAVHLKIVALRLITMSSVQDKVVVTECFGIQKILIILTSFKGDLVKQMVSVIYLSLFNMKNGISTIYTLHHPIR